GNRDRFVGGAKQRGEGSAQEGWIQKETLLIISKATRMTRMAPTEPVPHGFDRRHSRHSRRCWNYGRHGIPAAIQATSLPYSLSLAPKTENDRDRDCAQAHPLLRHPQKP